MTKDFILIFPWMIRSLKLKGNELLVYAVVYGFSKEDQGSWWGSLKYMSELTGASRRSVIAVLKSLTEKGLIKKHETFSRSGKMIGVEYTINTGANSAPPVQNTVNPSANSAPPPSANSAPNSITLDNIDNKIGRFTQPSFDDLKEYFFEKTQNVELSIGEAEKFQDHYTSNGWKVGKNHMKDWKAAVRNWLKNVKNYGPRKTNSKANGEWNPDLLMELAKDKSI